MASFFFRMAYSKDFRMAMVFPNVIFCCVCVPAFYTYIKVSLLQMILLHFTPHFLMLPFVFSFLFCVEAIKLLLETGKFRFGFH